MLTHQPSLPRRVTPRSIRWLSASDSRALRSAEPSYLRVAVRNDFPFATSQPAILLTGRQLARKPARSSSAMAGDQTSLELGGVIATTQPNVLAREDAQIEPQRFRMKWKRLSRNRYIRFAAASLGTGRSPSQALEKARLKASKTISFQVNDDRGCSSTWPKRTVSSSAGGTVPIPPAGENGIDPPLVTALSHQAFS